jgi:hypothetical protein
MPEFNTYVQIYDCVHGSIEVQLKEENDSGIEFYIILHPDEGYYLKNNKDLYIINHNENNKHNYASYSYKNNITWVIPKSTDDKNVYILKVDRESKLTITAFFTKIEQE